MHETITDGKIEFFRSNFIYKSLHLELRIKSYEFFKFVVFSGISCIRIIPVIELLRQGDVSGQRSRSRSNLTSGTPVSVVI